MLLIATALTGILGFAPALAAPNWSAVPAKDVTLFYPGQSSWEWSLTTADHPGADKFRAGKNCAACHTGDEKTMGALLASGKKNEPTPIAGKPGSLIAKVQFANDGQNLYVHLVFSDAGQPNAKMDNAYDTKVAMMIEDGSVLEANRAGCWGSCHEDSAAMPAAGGADRTMYLPKTRAHLSRQGGGDALAADLQKLKAGGYELEYWQARLNPGKPASAANGVIFDKREETKPTAVTAEATYSGGTWSVTLSRKLNAGAGFTPIIPGKRYTVAFAIHAGHTAKRFHYVSFERSMVLDQGDADFVASKK
ncbi:MAG: cytochrome c-552 precursor [Alphaproteobacteria bacterium]|nr:cytochrome c-552 precursor [Alphaproteobacteria bacterium]